MSNLPSVSVSSSASISSMGFTPISTAPSSPATPSATVIPRIVGATYTVYASKQALSGSSDLAFPDGTRGYVVCENGGKNTITTIGDAQKPVDIFGKRQFMCQVARDGICTLNGTDYTSVFLPDGVGASYVQDPECFVRIDANHVFIDMASNGFYCIDYRFLFCIKGVILNKPVQVKSNAKSIRSFDLPSSWLKIHHDGREEPVGDMSTTNMLTKDPSVFGAVLIDPEAKVRELFYIELSDGSFTNVEFSDFSIPIVALPAAYSGDYDILQGYRCIPLQPFKTVGMTASAIDTVFLDVTRYNNQTVKVKIQIYWMSDSQEKVYEARLEAKHPNQDSVIDFSMEPSIATINNAAPESMSFTKWHTKVICSFKSGETGEIHIYRDVITFNEVSASMKRFGLGEIFAPQNSSEVYIVDGKVYTTSARGPNFSADFDGKQLILRPRKGVSSYATYDGNGVWVEFPLRAKITFDSAYTYCITTVSAGKIEVSMKSFGDYDSSDTFTYTADGSALSKNVYKVKPDPNTAPEATIAIVKFTAIDSDKNVYPFTVTFVFKDFPRVSFLISDNQDFSSPYFRRTSFNGLSVFNSFWTYGPFLGQPNVPINALGNAVVNGSLESNIYPVITFNDSSAGTISKTKGCLQIKAQVLSDDLVIPVGPSDEYVRLNACSSVQYTGSTLTIPKNASVSFFRIGSVIWLLRSPLTRSVSFGSMTGLAGSANSSPTSGDAFPSPPGAVVATGARSIPTNISTGMIVSSPRQQQVTVTKTGATVSQIVSPTTAPQTIVTQPVRTAVQTQQVPTTSVPAKVLRAEPTAVPTMTRSADVPSATSSGEGVSRRVGASELRPLRVTGAVTRVSAAVSSLPEANTGMKVAAVRPVRALRSAKLHP